MKNKFFTGVVLALLAAAVSADVFSKTFNLDYPLYGFGQIGFTQSPPARALTQPENFATGGGITIVLDEARTDAKNGKFKIKLVARKGLTRAASLELVIQSDTVTHLNYITRLDFYDFGGFFRESVEIDWNGRESRLDDIIGQLAQILDRFYNVKSFGSL
ncbi:MAG: hypothetical protein LBC67_00535 [Spirochaetales bacterium]|nr:hypothetical protein [Spirochaetales bacterium]